MRNFLSVADLSPAELERVIERAAALKAGAPSTALAGKTAVLLFDKPSLRTKLSFDVGVHRLGGRAIYFSSDEVGMDTRELAEDVARVVSRMADVAIVRTFEQTKIERFTAAAAIPVVNALTDEEHPCQALADLLTMREVRGKLSGAKVAYIGDGNNIAASLALALAAAGGALTIASPNGYTLPPAVVEEAIGIASNNGASLSLVTDPAEAVAGADFVYTDTWTSMGQEAESERRIREFEGYRVDAKLLDKAAPGVRLMHDLPAHHGEEIEEGLFDDPRSIVFDQAENRVHAQAALLDFLFSGG